MSAELRCLLENKAIKMVTKEEAEDMMSSAKAEGKRVEQIPSKCVFTRKSGSGKYKTRVVACGNHMEERCATELYASGLDSTQLRSLLRKGSLEGWRAGSWTFERHFCWHQRASKS